MAGDRTPPDLALWGFAAWVLSYATTPVSRLAERSKLNLLDAHFSPAIQQMNAWS
ncbi:MAG TPA: hypothetical protein VLI55_15175 [Bryobacteraceae bacterium]|nr:hypothetical protein [Bryobacteraceae bacterium]